MHFLSFIIFNASGSQLITVQRESLFKLIKKQSAKQQYVTLPWITNCVVSLCCCGSQQQTVMGTKGAGTAGWKKALSNNSLSSNQYKGGCPWLLSPEPHIAI